MKKALTIPADGETPTLLECGDDKTYETIREYVGGWFDCVRSDKFHGYVNDTGLIDGLPFNPIASVIFGQVICGDAILFGSLSDDGEYDGEEYDIPEFVVAGIMRQWFLWKHNAEVQALADLTPRNTHIVGL